MSAGARGEGCPDVLITSGPTYEQLDDMRIITNLATGTLGAALARQYASLGHHVALFESALVRGVHEIPEGVAVQHFTTPEDLEEQMHAVRSPGLVLHAAAVGDFYAEPVEGKISSDEALVIPPLPPRPKILPTLRGVYGTETKIVGFKLLSGVTRKVLVDTAAGQIRTAGTDLCIANDLKERREERTLYIVDKDRNNQRIHGTSDQVAQQIAARITIPEPTYV